jgi:hypothetical protein
MLSARTTGIIYLHFMDGYINWDFMEYGLNMIEIRKMENENRILNII